MSDAACPSILRIPVCLPLSQSTFLAQISRSLAENRGETGGTAAGSSGDSACPVIDTRGGPLPANVIGFEKVSGRYRVRSAEKLSTVKDLPSAETADPSAPLVSILRASPYMPRPSRCSKESSGRSAGSMRRSGTESTQCYRGQTKSSCRSVAIQHRVPPPCAGESLFLRK